jgi:hypothetical protein
VEIEVGHGSRKVCGKNVCVLDSHGNAITMKIEDREVHMIQNQKVFVEDSKGNGTFLTLMKVQRGIAIFKSRDTRSVPRKKVVRAQIRKNRNAMRSNSFSNE